jgi:hypothetical protein
MSVSRYLLRLLVCFSTSSTISFVSVSHYILCLFASIFHCRCNLLFCLSTSPYHYHISISLSLCLHYILCLSSSLSVSPSHCYNGLCYSVYVSNYFLCLSSSLSSPFQLSSSIFPSLQTNLGFLTPGPNVIKLFTSIIYGFLQ